MSVLRIDRSELVTLEKPKKQDLVQDFFPDHMALWYVHSLCIKSHGARVDSFVDPTLGKRRMLNDSVHEI